MCLSTNKTGWYSERARIHFDLVLGDALEDLDQQSGKNDGKVSELVVKVRDLNHRVADIRREQVY